MGGFNEVGGPYVLYDLLDSGLERYDQLLLHLPRDGKVRGGAARENTRSAHVLVVQRKGVECVSIDFWRLHVPPRHADAFLVWASPILQRFRVTGYCKASPPVGPLVRLFLQR